MAATLKFDTKVDTDGAVKDIDTLKRRLSQCMKSVEASGKGIAEAYNGASSRVISLNGKIRETEIKIQEVLAATERLAQEQIPTEAYRTLCGELEKAENALSRLLDRREKMEAMGVDKESKQWKSLEYDIDQAIQKVERYETLTSKMVEQGRAYTPGDDSQAYKQKLNQLEQLTNKLSEYEAKRREALAAEQEPAKIPVEIDANSLEGQLIAAKTRLQELADQGLTFGNAEFDRAYIEVQNASAALGDYKKSLTSADAAQKNFNRSAAKIPGRMKKTKAAAVPLTKSILQLGNMLKMMVIRQVLRAMISAAKEGFENLAQYSKETNRDLSALKSSLTQLKNSFATAFAPILSVVTPALTGMINMLSKAVTYIGMFIAALSGKSTFTKAVAVQEDYAASLEGTASAAKKASKGLASFDHLEVLNESSSSSGSSGNAAVSDMFQEVEIDNKVLNFLDAVKEKTERVCEALALLGVALLLVKGFTAQGAIDFYNLFLVPVGNWVLGEGLPRLITALAEGMLSIDWSAINGNLAALWIALAPFTINVGEGLLWFWENVLVPLGVWTISDLLPLFLGTLSELLNILNGIIIAFAPAWTFLWTEFLQPLAAWTGGIILQVLQWFNDKLKWFSDWILEHQSDLTYFIGLLGLITAGFLAVEGGIKLVNFVVPVLKNLLSGLVSFITSPAGLLIALAAIVVWAGNGEEMLDNLKLAFGGLLDFITGVFTGDWEKAWEGIQDIFKGIFNGLIIIAESVANLVISALNSISFDVPDWIPGIGGKHVGFSLTPISLPRLASGTVVPPRAGEFAAILGDNKRETEVVSPLSTIKQALKEAMEESGAGKGQSTIVNLQVDGQTFATLLLPYLNNEKDRIGANLVKVTTA